MEGGDGGVVVFLKRTKSMGDANGGFTSGEVTMLSYVDFDNATCPYSRHSVSSGVILLGGGAIGGVFRVGINCTCGDYE